MSFVKKLTGTSVTSLSGIGKKVAERLLKINITNVMDLVMHIPTRYEDRSRITQINQAPIGEVLSVAGEVLSQTIKYGKRKVLTVTIKDGSGVMKLTFFSYHQGVLDMFREGACVLCYGAVKHDNFNGLHMMHPDCKPIASLSKASLGIKHYMPIYPLTEGVGQIAMRGYVQKALAMLPKEADEPLLPNSENRWTFSRAIHTVHSPPMTTSMQSLEERRHPAFQALIADELLAYYTGLLKLRHHSDDTAAPAFSPKGELRAQFLSNLPFSPTGAQKRVITEIDNDLSFHHPMMRLIQGDVGSGKTLVAAMAALHAIESGYQVALMAPTEILAEQHANGFAEWLRPLGLNVAWLAGKIKAKEKRVALEAIKSGSVDLVVGTHALFQDNVEFHRLGLLIVDEQHRFGVDQRLALREKGVKDGLHPHQLVMTATPIPRTLAMVAYADLDTSIIDELPPGRTPVKTVALPETRRPDIVERIRQVCTTENRQVYWVCTLIDESEAIESQAASDAHDQLAEALPELKVGLVHGRMKSDEKLAVMTAFSSGEVDILVATTVIEVGVNVPNASLMIIENPERLGLAQLHQLRGRVGRGSIASHCVLLYRSPLNPVSQQRLAALRDSNDGFVIAQKDLELRGPGEMLGVKQTGMAAMKVADLVRDGEMLESLRLTGQSLLTHEPNLVDKLFSRWQMDVETYGRV